MLSDREWFLEQVMLLPDRIESVSPIQWAEQNRYLPPSVTPLPGYYRYDVSPPLREIVECMDARSSIREVSLMKGAQLGATVGILENTIGYGVAVLKSAPMMFVSADADLVKLRMESYITPMIQQSGLGESIQSLDQTSSHKYGKTDKKVEWVGGGFLIPVGAGSAAKLRSLSIRYLMLDEIDGFPATVGKDGDPCKLAEARTKAYHATRKILRMSTPLIKGTSRIEREFKRGDQRRYYVPCKSCRREQVLVFQGRDENGKKTHGLFWEMDEYNILKPGSVYYVCEFCGHRHTNSDKSWMLPRGRWKPTAKPVSAEIRSYHLSGLYAPASMYPWDAVVSDWLECWDVYHGRPKDLILLQEFYNNNLGKSFLVYGEGVSFQAASRHRRFQYKFGQVPNDALANKFSQGPVQVLTCAVDVHKTFLAVAVFGWTRGCRSYLIDYWRLDGDCEQLDDAQTWLKLSEIIENKRYTADDGKKYRISLTLVDAGWSNETVCKFCEQYASAVYPIVGREFVARNKAIKEFQPFTTALGTQGYSVLVDMYKDRYAASLKYKWDGDSMQPHYHFNCPVDVTDDQLKELTVENKQPKVDKTTGKKLGYEWHRPSGARNELWDLCVYNAAALDMIAWDTCINQLDQEFVNWMSFWDLCESKTLFYEAA